MVNSSEMFALVKALVEKNEGEIADYTVGDCLKQVVRLVEAEMNFALIGGRIEKAEAAASAKPAPDYSGPKLVN